VWRAKEAEFGAMTVKKRTRFVSLIASALLLVAGLIQKTQADGIIVVRERPESAAATSKVEPFTVATTDENADKTYFVGKNGKSQSANSNLIVAIVTFPDTKDITREATVTGLVSKKRN
jgi:hypothetical protein